MHAVSVELENGMVVTLMPFADVYVSAGSSVKEGDCLGTLAPGGDVSSAQTHLHMGLKMGQAYCDPMSLFGLTSSQTAQDDQVLQDAPSASYFPDVHPGADIGEMSAEIRARELVDEAYAREIPNADPAPQESFGTIESGAVSWRPSTRETPNLVSRAGVLLEPLFSACHMQFADLVSALQDVSRGSGIPLSALIVICGIAGIALLATLVFVTLAFVAPRIGEIWRNRKIVLSAHGGGDSMHKLFPASGIAFTSRSR